MKAISILFVVLLAVPELTSAGNPAYFYYRNENKPLLHYFRFQNTFDSSMTTYVFGEVAMTAGGSTLRIPINSGVALSQNIAGANGTGEDTVLREYARTENFTLAGGGQISWFSEINSFRSPCDPEVIDPEPGEGPNVPTAAWGMLDRSEFVVELVSADSNTRIAVLDSIGAAPPQSGVLTDTRYGTNPQKVLKQYSIPSGLHGKKVYMRVSPRRDGPTPYGMTMCKIKNTINYSATYDSTGTTYISYQDLTDIFSSYFADLLDYCDSVKNATGWLPGSISGDGVELSAAESDTLHSRYFTPAYDSVSHQHFWIEIPPWVWSKRGAPPRYEGSTVEVVSIQKVIPNPGSDRVVLLLTAKVERQVVVRLYSSDGKAVDVWSGLVREGESSIGIATDTFSVGSYTIVVESRNGGRLSSAPFVISR